MNETNVVKGHVDILPKIEYGHDPIPSGVRIGGIEYDVLKVADLHDGDEKVNGRIDYNECVIRLESNMHEQAQMVTLWHEVLHAILTHAGKGEQDEAAIEALAYGVHDVIGGNPLLLPQR